MRWGMILLLVIIGIGLTGSAQANETNYWEGNMLVGVMVLPSLPIECPTDQGLPEGAIGCERIQVLFDVKHYGPDQIGALLFNFFSFDYYFNPGTLFEAWWNQSVAYATVGTIAPHPFASRMTDAMRFDGNQTVPGVANGVYGTDWLAMQWVYGQVDAGIMPESGE